MGVVVRILKDPSPGIRETNSRSRNENENGIGAGSDNDLEPLVG
jgi:hypothetical protein